MKILLLVLLVFSFNANAKLAEGVLHARCLAWSITGLFDKSISAKHAEIAVKTLTPKQIAFQSGVAEGLALGASKLGNRVDVSRILYNEICKPKKSPK